MIGWLFGGAMYLAQAIEYSVQTGRARVVSFKWLFPLNGLRATESDINGRVFGIIAIIATLVSVASGLGIAVSSI